VVFREEYMPVCARASASDIIFARAGFAVPGGDTGREDRYRAIWLLLWGTLSPADPLIVILGVFGSQ